MALDELRPLGSDLEGKVAFITGGGTGIGAGVARRLATRGVRVAIAGRRIDPLNVVAEAIGADVMAVGCDVADADSVEAAIGSVVERFDGLDIVVNNAGGSIAGSVESIGDDDWSVAVDVNLVGPARVAKAAVPHMRRRGGGVIANVSSIGGLFAARNAASYGTTKAGLIGLTRSMAVDFADDHIRVNTLCPGWVDTPMAAEAVAKVASIHDVSTDDARALMVGDNPIKRMADPDEIARCVEFLVSDASSFITGTTLIADGGQSAVDLGMLAMID